MKTTPLWSPPQGAANTSRMAQFMAEINAEFGANLQSFADLHGFSVRETEAFWSKGGTFWASSATRARALSSNWASGSKKRNSSKAPASTTPKTCSQERRPQRAWSSGARTRCAARSTWAELNAAAAGFQALYRAAGVAPGDRVAAIMPNMPEAIVRHAWRLAAAGAIWSSCSPDFGVAGVLDRFGQIGPKVLVAVDGYHYNGKSHPASRQARRNRRQAAHARAR